MKSLTLLSQIHLARFGRPAGKDIHQSVDPETGHVYVAYSTGPSESVLIKISDVRSPFPEITELATFPPENDIHADKWGQVRGVKFLVENQAICVIFSHGDVVLFHTEPTETGESLEIVGSVDSGLLCMEWSPDEELVIMVTGEGSILEMTKDFDVISENPIDVEEAGEEVSVNVGWGRKETQFHGTEGKQAAQRKVDILTFTYSPDDDGQHRLSWRGDGTFFCCSSKDKRHGRRVIRVYNREAILQSTSESVDMLEHGLSWRPSGNLIASSQRLPHRHDIVFFEKNGLRHGEFTLREPNETIVRELAWNCDSTVLAVWLQRPTTGSSCIQLWTMNNYKWYLKQELLYNGEDGSTVATFHWDLEAALVLHVVTESGSYQRNEYCWDIFVNDMLHPNNLGTVAVADGANLLITPFRVMNVPPPMAAFTLTLPYKIQHVSFSTSNDGDDLAILLTDQRVAFYEVADKTTRPLLEPKLLGMIELAQVPSVTVRQIAWVNSDTLIGLQYDSDVSADSIVVVKMAFEDSDDVGQNSSKKAPRILSRKDVPLEGLFQRLYFNQTYGDILLQQADGNLMSVELRTDGEEVEPVIDKWVQIHCLPECCLYMGTTRIGTGPIEYREKTVIGLAPNNRLYVNDRLISSEATSYCLHSHFLVFTTATHSARFLPLETPLSEFKVMDNSMLPYDESIRRVERGSKIVLAIPYSVNLVLQMPRGNLETVAPRAMVLSVTRDALDKCDFRTAFLTCRKHRIDLNILYDHNPKVFMENVAEFVKQIKEVDHLNLFLSFLRNEDVTQTLYPLSGFGSNPKQPQQQQQSLNYSRVNGGSKGGYKKTPLSPELAEKVNQVCDAIRAELQNLDRNTYINSVLTTYVRKSPPDLESALLLLAKLKDEDQALAEDALKFTIFLADVDRLFDVALGMYDFALVLMVAQWSQKDPREYLPFLNELRVLEKYHQRFKIDDHLKKYQSALQNLSQAGEKYFEDCIAYIKQHNLFKFALTIFGGSGSGVNIKKHKTVLSIYGDSLSVNGDHSQAAVAYVMAGDKEKALESYKEAGYWREAMVLARQLEYDAPATAYLARGLSERLKVDKNHLEASVLLVEYAKDTEEAVATLLEGRLWNEAIRIAFLYNRQDLMVTHITPGIADGHHDLMESIRDMQEQFDKQTKRLKDLRVEKALAEAEAAATVAEDGLLPDDVDLMSDTTSMASGFTRYTAANSVLSKSSYSSRSSSQYTARLKKRADRKRARGKKGSVYEEEYLINSLRKLILRVDTTKSDVHALLECLAASMSLERAKVLQQEFSKLLQDIEAHMHIIFVPPTEEYLNKKKAVEDAKNERKKLVKQMQAQQHLMSRHEEAVLQAQITQLEEVAEQVIADIYGEPPVMSKDAWDVDLV
ncbi:IKI3 family-domain-containing protein [Lobosporangium transversale]|uniref:Elongator complex protein 1 n=1 Tax=Lobosporangium transversale TaxID=64571 RepID=A0A1Y2GHV8_9FUNG|nr:IKI3 family-domain-containing protein [Lobosporangium transversale]ORZ11311.1 IKI3 family-domain-containing protein [Lobosporangium transversale]|eukprot:XP_021879626.1 IKI3 family-domain-containing protein [Lobosporangium transversale]